MSSRGWDYSVSVTDANKCRPVLDVVEDLPEHGWTDIGMGESATWGALPPGEEEGRAELRGGARDGAASGRVVPPAFAVILGRTATICRMAEVVRRHRGKQGHENAFKGPLVDMDLHHPPCRAATAANQRVPRPTRSDGAHAASRGAVPSAAEARRAAARHPAAGAPSGCVPSLAW